MTNYEKEVKEAWNRWEDSDISVSWVQRRGQIKHLLYEMCLTGRIDKATFCKQLQDLNKVEPVKHGRWIKRESKRYYWFECSECGYPPPLNRFYHEWFSDYCPNCGARMDISYSDHTDYKGDISYTNHTVMDEVEE